MCKSRWLPLATSHGEGSKAIEFEMALRSSVNEHDEKKEEG